MNLPAARRRTLGSVLAFVSLTALAVVAFRTQPPKEPELNGKPLSYYLDLQTYGELRTERNARESITDFGTNAVPHLIRILESRLTRLDSLINNIQLRIPFFRDNRIPLWIRQHQAALACAELGPHAISAVPALSNLVAEPMVGATAVAALMAIDAGTFPILTNCLILGSPEARSAAAGALRRATNNPAIVSPLLGALRDLSPSVRASAASSLALVGASEPQILPALIAALSDTDSSVRFEVVQSLGWLAEKAAPAVPALLELHRTEESPILQHRIEQTLRIISPTNSISSPLR